MTDLEEGNSVLRRENEELRTATLPKFCTPYHPFVHPSLHEEISRHGNLTVAGCHGHEHPSPTVPPTPPGPPQSESLDIERIDVSPFPQPLSIPLVS